MQMTHLLDIVRKLDDAEVKYLVVGGVAVIAYGYARATHDLDLVVEMTRENLRTAIDVLLSMGYRPRVPVDPMDFADETVRERWRREKNMLAFTMIPPDDRMPQVDLMMEFPFEFAEAHGRMRSLSMGDGTSMPVVSITDLRTMKTLAGRDKDRDDLQKLEIIESAEGRPSAQ